MVNYQNSKIYRVVCSETNNIYIGSTTRPLSQRLGKHKNNFNTCMTKNFINPKIFLIENCPCNSKEELHSIERKYIENIECVNKIIPGRTPKEWRKENKEYYKDYFKDYYLNNKEKFNEKSKEYRQKNKEHIKEWRQNNKESIALKNKEYKEKRKEKLDEKFECECGGKFSYQNKSIHLKSKKHIKYINSINTNLF